MSEDLTAEETIMHETSQAPPVEKLVRRYGWVRDTPKQREQRPHAAKLFGAPARMAAQGKLSDVTPSIKNQLNTNSCFGFAAARAVDTRLRKLAAIAGQLPGSVPEHSALGIYTIGRIAGLASPKDTLVDEGTNPSLGVPAMQTIGVPLESSLPFDPMQVLTKPALDVLEDASGFRLDDLYKIDAEGGDLVNAIAVAINAGYPVIFGTAVDQAFEDYSGGGLVLPSGSSPLGDHMLCLLDYDFSDPKNLKFTGANSWGTEWGNAGFFDCGADFVTTEKASDFYVVEIVAVQASAAMRTAARKAKVAK